MKVTGRQLIGPDLTDRTGLL